MSPELVKMLVDAELMLNAIEAEVGRLVDSTGQVAVFRTDISDAERLVARRLLERLRGVLVVVQGSFP